MEITVGRLKIIKAALDAAANIMATDDEELMIKRVRDWKRFHRARLDSKSFSELGEDIEHRIKLVLETLDF